VAAAPSSGLKTGPDCFPGTFFDTGDGIASCWSRNTRGFRLAGRRMTEFCHGISPYADKRALEAFGVTAQDRDGLPFSSRQVVENGKNTKPRF
jgi:hypothetical protein